jgi:hypothetical protein
VGSNVAHNVAYFSLFVKCIIAELAENKTSSNGEQIYVVSDKPFEETESIPVEFAILSIDR